jgi:hypothetical protein
MTPKQLYDTYRSLSVDLADGTTVFGLDIHKYRINTSATGLTGTGPGQEAYDKLKAKVVKAAKKTKTNGYLLDETVETNSCPLLRNIERIQLFPDLWRPFVGKGSPEEIRQALRLAVFFGLVGRTKGELQAYCDANIGVDCSGFASNFYGGKWIDKGANNFRDTAKEVTKIEDIRANDAICFVTTNHIAVIDCVYQANQCTTKGDPVLQGMVAESTAARMIPNGPSNGIAYTEYLFLPKSQTENPILRQTATPTLHLDKWKIKIVRPD